MGLEQRRESPLSEPLTDSSPHPVQRGYPGLTTKITRRGLLVSVLAGLAAVGYKETPARADDEGIVVVDGIPVEVSGIQAGGEPPLSPKPAGFKTEDGYAWDDGKSIIIGTPLIPADFDRVPDVPLKDIQTGQDRPALPLHTEMRSYLDLAGADRLVFTENPSLAQRYADREKGVYPHMVGRANPKTEPNAIFAYVAITMRPTDDPEHPNDIRVDYFLNPNYPTPPRGDMDAGGFLIPDAYESFRGNVATDLAQIAFTFRNTESDTRYRLPDYGFNPGEPVSNLSYNMGQTSLFEIVT